MKKVDKNLFLGGGVVAAVAASLCCILPVVSIAFGLGAFGAAAFFESVRPYLLVVVVLALAFSFYQTYFRREKCVEGEICATKSFGRFNEILLWVATVAIGTFALFPHYSGYIVSALDSEPKSTVGAAEPLNNSTVTPPTAAEPATDANDFAAIESQTKKTIVIPVEGMTCESCATHIGIALKRIQGVYDANANYPAKNVKVVYNPKQVTVERIKQGIRDAGYDPK